MVSGCVCRPGAAEFPHDNEQIDRGVLWIGGGLAGAEAPRVKGGKPTKGRGPAPAPGKPAAVAEVPRAPMVSTIIPPPMVDSPPIEIPRPARAEAANREAPLPASVETPAAESASHGDAKDDERIELFVRTIADVARAHGAAECAVHVEHLFKFGTPAPIALSDNARLALRDGNILEIEDGPDHATTWFTSTSSAWQTMLRGGSGDLSACGDSTLDTWTAELIARLVAKPGMAPTIRSELRRRGIAAFGMLEI